MGILKSRNCAKALVACTVLLAGLAQSDDSSNGTAALELYKRLQQAFNAGDLDAVVALYADDASVVAGANCPAKSPCVGKEKIRTSYAEALIKSRIAFRPLDSSVDAGSARVRSEVVSDTTRKLGLSRIVGTAQVQAKGGRITNLVFTPDPQDAETKQYLQSLAPAAAK